MWYSFIYTPTLPARLLHKARAARLLQPGGAAKARAQACRRRPPRPAPDAAARARCAQVRRRAAGRHQPIPGPLPAAAGRSRAVGPGHRPLPALGCASRLRLGSGLGSGLGHAHAPHRTRPPWHPQQSRLPARSMLLLPVCTARAAARPWQRPAQLRQSSLQGAPGGRHCPHELQHQRWPPSRARRPEPALAAAEHHGGPGLRGSAAGRAVRPAGAPPRAVPGRA